MLHYFDDRLKTFLTLVARVSVLTMLFYLPAVQADHGQW